MRYLILIISLTMLGNREIGFHPRIQRSSPRSCTSPVMHGPNLCQMGSSCHRTVLLNEQKLKMLISLRSSYMKCQH